MKYYRSRFFNALNLLEKYKYPEPFHIVAKGFFKQHKKFGSKDRKAIAEICYTYFRTGLLFKNKPLNEGLIYSGLFLEWRDWQDWVNLAQELGIEHTLDELPKLKNQFRHQIKFYPDDTLMSAFKHYNAKANLNFRPQNWGKDHLTVTSGKLGLPGSVQVHPNMQLESNVQVQDLSSQYLCNQIELNEGDKVWDVCSGAGGKSLNLANRDKAQLYLSDVRPQILENAKARMNQFNYDAKYGLIDATQMNNKLTFGGEVISDRYFDVIITDVPCTGSGTWFSTPEHFAKFNYDDLEDYVERQKQIVQSCLPFLKSGGRLYYMTCSVFVSENKHVTGWILKNMHLELDEEICFNGIKHSADAMYMASFTKVV